ncbi:uncharacterized protein THITE_2115904 [Thermothielavioides terrestris NRRL 8126]|uniref:CENP-V/GFA domain-containing protein n=1 Tax=Thermothielavioides terrestris (strain ATCC 38088 / NRRL 8126) TaxID=578455 RepID=G2QYW4_THETT|nr:uncharacterized protein THITE_2115904 [Thermothielavioides terrestris NRRL 8126]AEO67103.1 hypothetical protein THITE_2115904 [Thermothielavioides terrestris NRRL 8126]
MSEPEQPTKKYRGNCHCGAFVFEVEAPEIKSLSDCNCSICTKRGYLWLVPKSAPTIIKDDGKLVHYAFAGRNMDHQFCGNCGITVLAASDMFPAKFGVNARTIQGLNVWDLEIKTFDGAAYDPQYVAPAYSGPELNPAGFEDANTYHGSCHCGAVTTAVRIKGSPEDNTYKERILECNCSICQRAGYLWIYPSESQVAIQGRENLSTYVFGTRVFRKVFCKTCGVHIGAEPNPDLTDEEIAALPEVVREFRATRLDLRPMNLRAFNGLDLKRVKPTQVDGWSRGQQYANP